MYMLGRRIFSTTSRLATLCAFAPPSCSFTSQPSESTRTSSRIRHRARPARRNCLFVDSNARKMSVAEESEPDGTLLESAIQSTDEGGKVGETARVEGDVLTADIPPPEAGTEGQPEAEGGTSDLTSITFDSKTSKWKSNVDVPRELIRFIVGVKGATKRKLEEETSCALTIPSKGKKENPIGIVSTVSAESVERCRDRIQLLVSDAREKAPYTHFVSFPITNADIQASYSKFVETIKNDEELPESCREPSLFQESKKLHLTLVMLSLLDSSERSLATKTLEEVVRSRTSKILDGKPLVAEIKGLEYMNDDPSSVKVLYATAICDRLEEVANLIADGMGEAGIAPRRNDKVKIHLTLMNTKYAFEKAKKKIRMDITKLMEKYGDYEFGQLEISEVQICCMSDPNNRHEAHSVLATVKI